MHLYIFEPKKIISRHINHHTCKSKFTLPKLWLFILSITFLFINSLFDSYFTTFGNVNNWLCILILRWSLCSRYNHRLKYWSCTEFIFKIQWTIILDFFIKIHIKYIKIWSYLVLIIWLLKLLGICLFFIPF